ncbi:MAG TPA: hypothetical protein VK166_07900 [Chitinophagaceae bacterium]|nr:hypothetical protein [Chitinophagaceae bacterium]
MTRQAIIIKTVKAINQLPPDKAVEISDFAEFLTRKYEEHLLPKGLAQIISEGPTFDFLRDEVVEYSVEDLKIVFDAKG